MVFQNDGRRKLPLALILLSFFTWKAFSFPELVRAGYANCVLCHYSPSGGGALTEYGRALSQELLSTWGQEYEGDFLWGNLPPKKPWILAGEFRALQTYQKEKVREQLRFIMMQADIEAGVDLKSFFALASVGLDYDMHLISRQHYAMQRFSNGLSARAGKFNASYGLGTENHSIGVRRGIGKDQGTETYNLEGAWNGKLSYASVTAILGRPDSESLGVEAGLAANYSTLLGPRHKVGFSYYYGARNIEQRHVLGPYFVVAFTQPLVLMGEFDFQHLIPKDISIPTLWGFVNYLRLDYEFYKGMHLYLFQEYSRLDTPNPDSTGEAYGLGFQFFPRPHLESNLVFQSQRFGGPAGTFTNVAFLMLHLYL